MKKLTLLLLVFTALFAFSACKDDTDKPLSIFKDGRTEYTIITEEGASGDISEIAKALSELSGAEILTDSSSEAQLEIVIGDTKRASTEALYPALRVNASALYFNYIISEGDGKLTILSDSDIGYIYALEHIKENYINGGDFSVPSGLYVLNRVLWDEYYSTDIYYNRLLLMADGDRYSSIKEQLKDIIERYDEEPGHTVMKVDEVLTDFKNQLASFNSQSFGTYPKSAFISGNKYRKPTVYPSGTHPSIMFTANTAEELYENIAASESAFAYKKYIALSNAIWDGKFEEISGDKLSNWDSSLAAILEAKAFRYAMDKLSDDRLVAENAKIYGYEAIIGIKNAILTISVSHDVGDWCRTYGYLMYVAGCVYDWCYDLMTEEDKEQIIAGGVNLLGKHLEIVCYGGTSNVVPNQQGTMYGHGGEDQILVDYLSFAIATYTEAPEIYELVGGRVLNDFVEAQNFMFQSGSHWEGTMYGSVRTASTIVSNILINKMTDGAFTPFENVDEAIITSTYYVRPDGDVFRIGDVNENNTSYQFAWFANCCFYAGNLYGNDYLKSTAYKYLKNFSSFTSMVSGLSAVQFLAVNDPAVSHTYDAELPLTRTAAYPLTNLFARSAHDDENAFAVHMTMHETYSASHTHMECGSFQIYYKGILAADSGAYTHWGDAHHMGYNMQTISSNSLLIYNPALVDFRSDYRKNMVYSGGQSIANGDRLPETLTELLKHEAFGQCTSLGVANVEKDGKYLYSYMGGDMTKAYDAITVDEVTRYMFAVATGNEDCPLVFLTYDRIGAKDASFRKSALIHVQEEPAISGDFAIVTNTKGDNSGKMIVQTVGEATEYTVVGGKGREFWIPGVDEDGNYSLEDGKNLPTGDTLVTGSRAEYGWGRIEISPKNHEKTNTMLTVMYVTDAENNASPIRASEISSEKLSGAVIFGKAVMFPKSEKLLSGEASFTLNEGAECFVAGVKAGTWTVTNGTSTETVEVADGTNLITFTAGSAGTYKITPKY